MTRPTGSQVLEWLALSLAMGFVGGYFIYSVVGPAVVSNLQALLDGMQR